jgi:molybdopterin-guanine dinucleotide biosynthesis protein A
MPTAGIILCGGQSSRMGRPKATLPFGPELMLQRVVRLLAEVVEPIVVVAAPGQELPPLPAGVLIARDEREGRGPLEGMFAGLCALEGEAEAAYVTSCDVPLLVPDFVRQMIARLGSHEIAVPVVWRGKRLLYHPLAAVYRLSVQERVGALLKTDTLRVASLFDECDTLRVPVEELRGVDPELATLANLNRPEEYEAALAKAGFA